MTSNRLIPSLGYAPARTGIALLVFLSTVFAVVTAASCGDEDTTTNNYIGVTDATPPRLGSTADGGQAR
jgi:hypothetical protein